MTLFGGKVSPEDVFTPRSHDLNQKTYAERKNLESRLRRALAGYKYVILHGESGNGKTWLYKRVFQSENVPYQVVNLAKMHNEGSLNAVLMAKVGELGGAVLSSEKSEMDAGFKPGGVGAGYKSSSEKTVYAPAAFETLAQTMHSRSNGKMNILVLDNFEQIVDNQDFVRQIARLRTR